MRLGVWRRGELDVDVAGVAWLRVSPPTPPCPPPQPLPCPPPLAGEEEKEGVGGTSSPSARGVGGGTSGPVRPRPIRTGRVKGRAKPIPSSYSLVIARVGKDFYA